MFVFLPRILLYVAFFLLPFTFLKLYDNLHISDLLIIISFLIIAISTAGKKFLLEKVLFKNIFLIPILIFSLGFLLSINRSILPYESITAYLQVVFIFLFAYPLLQEIILNQKQIKIIATMLVLPGIFISIIMIMLKILSIDIGIDLLAMEGWGGRLSYGGMEPSIPGRIILQNIPFLAIFILTTKNNINKILSILLILLQSLAIFLTASRSTFLTFILGLILFLIFLVKSSCKIRVHYFISIMLISILIIVITYHFNAEYFIQPLERYSTILHIDKSPSSLQRLQVIDRGFNYINRNPFIGLGMENSYLYTKISLHNPILLAWLENGIFGIIGFSSLYCILLYNGFRSYRNKFYGSYLLLGLTVIMAMMVFGDMFMANSYKRVLWLPSLLMLVYAQIFSKRIKN